VGVGDCVVGNGGGLSVDWGSVGDLRVRPIVGKCCRLMKGLFVCLVDRWVVSTVVGSIELFLC
jgi:hypothetical protein